MSSTDSNRLRKEPGGFRSVGTILILALVAVAVLFLLLRSCGTSAYSSTVADMLVIEPVGSIGARQIVQRTKGDVVRIQWSKDGRLRDTVLHYGALDDEEGEVERILANADRMSVDQVQRGLKTIIWRSTVVEIDTMLKSWSLIIVGPVPFREKLIEPDETDLLRRNPKLDAWFFLPPWQDNSPAVTDTLIKLLRNEGVNVKREILR